MDDLRRLLGLSSSSPAGEEEQSDDGDETEEEPRHPELAPRPVELLNGQTTIVGAALRVTLVVVAVLIGLAAAFQLAELLLVFIVALIVATAMHQPVAGLEQRGLPRPLAMLISYGSLLAVIVLFGLLIAGPLVSQVERLIEEGPELVMDLRDQSVELIDGLAGPGAGEDFVQAAEGALGQVDFGGLVEIPLQAAGIVVNIVIILFLSAMLVLERDRAARWFLPLVSRNRRRSTERLGKAVLRRLGRFIHGQLLIMTLMGIGMFVGLTVLGVPFAVPLALFAFMVEAMPMVGPWIAAIPAVAVAFAQSPTDALLLIVWWTILQQVESYILTPMILGRVQHLSATVVLLSVLGGFELFGVVGALIAVPVVAAISMVIEAVLRPARRRTVEEQGARRPSRA